jgi:uncharacterized DUF497 family protein
MKESWNTLKRYVNLKKRGRRLDFAEAMSVAEAEYNLGIENPSSAYLVAASCRKS